MTDEVATNDGYTEFWVDGERCYILLPQKLVGQLCAEAQAADEALLRGPRKELMEEHRESTNTDNAAVANLATEPYAERTATAVCAHENAEPVADNIDTEAMVKTGGASITHRKNKPSKLPRPDATVQVFDLKWIAEMKGMADVFTQQQKNGKSCDTREERMNSARAKAIVNNGVRIIRRPTLRLDGLREDFPNFNAAIDLIESELALAFAGKHADTFQFSPLLLLGEPGCGKSFFGEQLAALLNTGYERIPVGTTGGSFELCGTSAHYQTSRPGRIFQSLAVGETANPVVLLDEIDKAHGDRQGPVENALLDLLEPRTAKSYRDHSMDTCVDASKMIFIATANDLRDITPPVRSRLEVVEVKNPTSAEKRVIIRSLWMRLVKSSRLQLTMDEATLDHLVASSHGPRELWRKLRVAAGRALVQKRRTIIIERGHINRPGIGFA